MNTQANNRRISSRTGRELTVTPVAFAIRAVLAISGTLLALGGSGAAFAAGTCVPTTTNTFSCNGDFVGVLPGVEFVPVVDMTLILGDSAPTSVIPAPGQIGVDATWGGNVGVTSFADIVTEGADGMHVSGTTSATVDNQGSITTNVTAADAMALYVYANGDVSIINTGDVLAYSAGVYDVTAISATSSDGDVLIDNVASGTITAQARDGNAIAVLSFAQGSGTISNEGTITARSINGVALGVLDQAYNGDASVTNSGLINVQSNSYQAFGVLASSSYGHANVSNAGVIQALGGQDQTFGVQAAGLLGSSIENSGTIAAFSTLGSATAALAYTVDDAASVTNSGKLYAYAYGVYNAVGMQAESANGTASVDNSNFIRVITRVNDGTAIGMAAYSGSGSSVSNTGYMLAGSYSSATIGGIAVAEHGDATATNGASGYLRSISENQIPGSSSVGLVAESHDGNASVTNDGRLVTTSRWGDSTGMRVRAADGDASAVNSGYMTSKGIQYSNSVGISAVSSTGLATVDNFGTILAGGSLILGEPTKDKNNIRGVEAVSYAGTTVSNSGTIQASGAWYVHGILAGVTNGDVSVTNSESGRISAMGMSAYGIFAEAFYGQYAATVDNAGSIQVIQTGNCYCNGQPPVGVGIKATAIYASGGAAINNSGSIEVISQHSSYGLWALAQGPYGNGDVTVDNSGSIHLFSTGFASSNRGISVESWNGAATAVNSGDITIEIGRENTLYFNVDSVWGMNGQAGRPNGPEYYPAGETVDGGGDVRLDNSGNITILGAQTGYGMQARGHYQQAIISNSGDITLVSDGLHSYGTGMFAWAGGTAYAHNPSYNNPNAAAIVENSGHIQVAGQGGATGIRALLNGSAGADITNHGDITAVASGARSYGVWVNSMNNGPVISNDVSVENTGLLAAINHAGSNDTDTKGGIRAVGILTTTITNNIIIDNAGDIVADVTAGTCEGPGYACFRGATVGSAIGILAANGYGALSADMDIVNSGTIRASADSSSSELTRHYAYFLPGSMAAGIFALGNYGDVTVTNAGDISVVAKGRGLMPTNFPPSGPVTFATTAAGILASNDGSQGADFSNMLLTNSGSITVLAEATYADGTALAVGIGGKINNGAYSTGSDGQGITVVNSGVLSVAALTSGEGTGAATANGISAVNMSTDGGVAIANDGRIQAVATGPGVVYATGIWGSATSAGAVLGENSVITVQATGASGSAIGLSISGDVVSASNAGILQAEFIGEGGDTYGALIASLSGDVTFTNSGSIRAIDADYAIGVQLDSLTATTLINSGVINALSETGTGVALRTGDSTDLIQNTGTLGGALVTKGGNDTLANDLGGVWHATGSSDFGAGTDTINNVGTILLDNAVITMGDSTTFDNAFTSSGLIRVSGDNTIDMGVHNVLAFSNSGILDFRDGVAGDILTINGDFSGSGAINLDVSGLNTSGDLLYVNGNIAADSISTINVSLLSLPTSQTASMPLIYVSGDSTATAFELGEVRYDPDQNFLTLNYNVDLEAAIDASNATPDVFSLGVSVSGLSDSGTLAATIAPGAQSLLNSQVGTWRQRTGVIDKFRKGGVALWARLFQDSGVVSPQHVASNFGQDGNFAFDQRNSGTEVGADFAISDALSVGVLAGKSDGRQRLQGAGLGASTIDGNTYGAYATWLSPTGFYLDASYRHMRFDAKLHTPAGEIRTTGNANALSLEGGYAWILGNGLKIEPQVQYTRIQVGDIGALSGALARFQSEGGDSSRGRVGVMFRKGFGSDGTVWTPYASINAVREFDGKNRFSINDDFFGETNAKGTNALVEAGLNVDMGRLSVFGGATWQDGGALESVVSGQVGMRFAW